MRGVDDLERSGPAVHTAVPGDRRAGRLSRRLILRPPNWGLSAPSC